MITKRKFTRFQLPTRIRNRNSDSGSLLIRLALLDRITELPNIETLERTGDSLAHRVDVYFSPDSVALTGQKQSSVLLCCLDCDGVMISGLDDWGRYQVVSRGWGKLISDQVLVVLPRDGEELDACWRILERAHENLCISSTRVPGSRLASNWGIPRISRTALQ